MRTLPNKEEGFERPFCSNPKVYRSSIIRNIRQKIKKTSSKCFTTIEIKSGYGLDLATERKILRVAKQLEQYFSGQIYKTFLGLHAILQNINIFSEITLPMSVKKSSRIIKRKFD